MHLEYGGRVPDMVCTNSWLRYDEIAVPRILKMFRDYGLKQTFFYPSWCMEAYPELVEMNLKDGHEIGHHGHLHENYTQLTREDQVFWTEHAIDIIQRMTGQRRRGFRAPVYNFSRHTADILAHQEFVYDPGLMVEDVPYMIQTDSGSFLELPSHWALDDWPDYVHNIELEHTMPIRSPDEAMNVYLAEFEAAYQYGGLWVAIWHPWVSGRTARCMRIAQMIEYMQSKGDVWFATLEEIAAHVTKCEKDGFYVPRSVKLPYYTSAIPEREGPQQIR